MLGAHLAEPYNVETRVLNQAVKRNLNQNSIFKGKSLFPL